MQYHESNNILNQHIENQFEFTCCISRASCSSETSWELESISWVINFHNPWPCTSLVGLISRSYSWREVTQWALFSPRSFYTNKFRTTKNGTITFVWDLIKKGLNVWWFWIRHRLVFQHQGILIMLLGN